ncbi:hypothetical protein CK623_04440 [Vandammella animalimorsus]|uniref:SH3b domain-containing protein n=1 Tax=Vandammella animalimorsus TaxID=2029117 RepID=A0A2A2ASD0_9BURK|nr:SH3 domain-containing protein [Vandammella animalimorsus]PAT40631.1 hypothetical protein CK623_04440 [Vandammella animalimorsus]
MPTDFTTAAPRRRLRVFRALLLLLLAWLCLAPLQLTQAAQAVAATGAGQGKAAQQALLVQADLPACEREAPGKANALVIGLADPAHSGDVAAYAVGLALASPSVSVCAEGWAPILPRWTPWARALERGYGFVAFALALVLAVGVLHVLLPRHWWHKTTLMGVLATAVLTWLTGVGMLALFHALGGQKLVYGHPVRLWQPAQGQGQWLDVSGARELEAILTQREWLPRPPAPAMAQARPQEASDPGRPGGGQAADTPAATPLLLSDPSAPPEPQDSYTVYHRLNLREHAGVHAPLIGVLPRGATVQYNGARQGDWWQVRSADGATGWVSSLWLRRQAEAR